MQRFLHIVCACAPLPADCGVSIDIINRIKAFHNAGVSIYLHFFDETEQRVSKELDAFCKTVNSYKTKNTGGNFNSKTPHHISSFINAELIENLGKDNHPILLEGLNMTGLLHYIKTDERKICVRINNSDPSISQKTSNIFRRIYDRSQNLKTRKHIAALPKNISYACMSESTSNELQKMALNKMVYIPSFLNWQTVDCPDGVGNLCLFHGNLSVAENEKAALWLLCNVFNKVRVPFVIAGKKPSRRLRKAAELCQHTCLIADPTDQELDDLIQKAHINVLPLLGKQNNAVHLKLLHALYRGRHCVVNPAMVDGTGLKQACHVGNNQNAITSIISQLYYQPFNEEEVVLRKELLHPTYNNEKNIQKFTNLLW